jgi:hypothetical protein
MKLKALSVLAGLGGSLIVCDPAPGEYLGLTRSYVPNSYGILTYDVYAEFDNPDDHVLAVAGTAVAPISLDAVGGTFWQQPTFGGETAPNPALIGLIPSLAYDTFVTIGVKVNDGTDATQLTPGWPGVGEAGLTDAANLAWFVTPDDAQGRPNEFSRVLIGRFSTVTGTGIRGRLVILAISDGEPMLIHTGFCLFLTDAPCVPGDLDFNNIVNVVDFLEFLTWWGPCPDPWECFADLDGDGMVNVVDFLLLLGNWTPPPEALPLVDADVNGDGVVNNIDLLTLLGCWVFFGAGCESADLDGDGTVAVRDLLIVLAGWG